MKNMKPGQYFALGLGIVFLLIGIMGFIPALVTEPRVSAEAANLGVANGYGYLMGLFPINVLHNIVHITFGLAGILTSISLGSARLYSGIVGLSYGLLAVMGLFPATSSTLGLIPIFGNDVWLHVLISASATYFGFIATPDLLELRSAPSPESTTRG